MLRLTRSGQTKYRVENKLVTGFALDNDTPVAQSSDPRAHIRAKVANVAAEVQHMRWGAMDGRNRVEMKEKLAAGQLMRNTREGWQPLQPRLVLAAGLAGAPAALPPGRMAIINNIVIHT
ncbi:MAG: hypothetical protein GY772_09470 [bacterium]|nr:hypothetical protein [bacterium]